MLYTKSLHLDVQPLPFEWKPCFTCAVLELGQATCPSPHQPSRHIRSMNWQLSKLFELDSNITQISTHFLKYYTNIYTLSPGFDGLQGFTKISRKLKWRIPNQQTKKNSHPLMHLTNTMSAWAQKHLSFKLQVPIFQTSKKRQVSYYIVCIEIK